MHWSFTLGSIAGTAIRVHITFLLLLIWIGAADYFARGAEAAAMSVIFIILVFACVVAHEFGHILTARRFGVKTPDVILSPIGGMANLERIPEKPRQELLVAIAGPVVNVVIAALLLAVWPFPPGGIVQFDFETASLVQRLAFANITLVAFNLLPAFPMDGGRVLRALLAMKLGPLPATEIAVRIGQGFAMLFALAGLFFNPLLLLLGFFVYFAADAEQRSSAFRIMARGLKVRDAMERPVASLAEDSRLKDAVDALLMSPQRDFPVLDGECRVVGLLDRETLFAALKSNEPATPVARVMRPVTPIAETLGLEKAVAAMTKEGVKAQAVIDSQGRVCGMLTLENIGEFMAVQEARPGWRFDRRSGHGRQ